MHAQKRAFPYDDGRVFLGLVIHVERQPAVYILTNRPFGTLYVGATSNLPARVWAHDQELVDGFTRRYSLHRLVWYEVHASMYAAITRERQIKKWNRAWTILLIPDFNPSWSDLSESIGVRKDQD
jgi:putative endonuclease